MEFQIEEDTVYVLDKNENLIVVFKKDDEDTIINPRVTETQNGDSVFTFSIALNNPKWKEIKSPENLYIVNNKMYSTNFDGCFTKTINESNEDIVSVIAYERQKLLSRKFVRAWNSMTGFDGIDTFMVVVLSNGDMELSNNGNIVNSEYQKGSSGYVLDALLYGTGWTTGICDVEGTFDFETDMVDIYDNILKVQEMWGGILVFDSLNKTVSHRDETQFLPYDGYEVKYQKNMQSSEQLYNNKIITKLCPLGEGGLNIKSINNDSEWITNFSYTDTILEGIENNPDITDQEQLKRWGERKLQDLCKPRKELTVKAVLLYQLEGYELEKVKLNDIVDVINYKDIENTIEQLRVIEYDYGLWDKSDAILTLSDITLDSTDIFKKTVKATNEINAGTLNTNKIIIYYKNGESLTQTIKHVDRTIQQTKSEFSKADDEIRASVQQSILDIDSLNNEITNQKDINSNIDVKIGEVSSTVEINKNNTEQQLAQLRETADNLRFILSNQGGNNLIKNSDMANGTKFWNRYVSTRYYKSDIPPQNVTQGTLWYCTNNYDEYVKGTVYIYNNGIWDISSYTRQQLDSEISFNFVDTIDDFNTIKTTNSGRIIKFDGNKVDTHLFIMTNLIDYKTNEEYLSLSFKIKNMVKTGNIEIMLGWYHHNVQDISQIQNDQMGEAIHVQDIFLTPDDCENLSEIKLEGIKNIKKENLYSVNVSATEPTDKSIRWLDNSLGLGILKKWNGVEWEIDNSKMSCYDINMRNIYLCIGMYNYMYIPTNLNYDLVEIKSLVVAITIYGGSLINTDASMPPMLPKGWYWVNIADQSAKIYRAKYDGDTFVEMVETQWYTSDLQAMQAPMPPYQVRISGQLLISDLKLEYGNISTPWSRYPR